MEAKDEYTIEVSDRSVQSLKDDLKLGDKYTMETILEYLKIDNFEIVKNLANIVNNNNVSEVYQ